MTAAALAHHFAAHQTVRSKRFVISIDDGMADGLTAKAILDDFGWRATFYVIPNRVGTPGYLTWAQIAELRAGGMDIGNHTLDHPHLDTLGYDAQRAQILGAQDTIQARLGMRPVTMAYPFGAYNDDTLTIATTEFLLSFRTGFGAREEPANAQQCERLYATSDMPPSEVLTKIAPYA